MGVQVGLGAREVSMLQACVRQSATSKELQAAAGAVAQTSGDRPGAGEADGTHQLAPLAVRDLAGDRPHRRAPTARVIELERIFQGVSLHTMVHI